MPSSSASECQRTCQTISECSYWLYTGRCHFRGAGSVFITDEFTHNYVTGPQFCDSG